MFRLLSDTVIPEMASGEKFALSAASISGTRNTPSWPAPVMATRTPAACFGDEGTDQRKAARGLGELLVVRRLRYRKFHGGDDFGFFQRGFEQAEEEIIRSDFPGIRHDRRTEAKQGAGIICRRVVIGDRTADGAAMADLRVADHARQFGQGRDRGFHRVRFRDLCMRGCCADGNRAAFGFDAA